MLSNRCVKEEKNISQICTDIPNGVDFSYSNCYNKTITKGVLFCICNREYSTYQLIDLDDNQLVTHLLSNWDSSIRTFIDDGYKADPTMSPWEFDILGHVIDQLTLRTAKFILDEYDKISEDENYV